MDVGCADFGPAHRGEQGTTPTLTPAVFFKLF